MTSYFSMISHAFYCSRKKYHARLLAAGSILQ